jgi:hypothetical protein
LAASWRFRKPGFHHTIDVRPVGVRVLTVHPLPVQPDAKFVHADGGLEALYLRCLERRRAIRFRSVLTKARNYLPECPFGVPAVSGHIVLCLLAQMMVGSPTSLISYTSERRGI